MLDPSHTTLTLILDKPLVRWLDQRFSFATQTLRLDSFSPSCIGVFVQPPYSFAQVVTRLRNLFELMMSHRKEQPVPRSPLVFRYLIQVVNGRVKSSATIGNCAAQAYILGVRSDCDRTQNHDTSQSIFSSLALSDALGI